MQGALSCGNRPQAAEVGRESSEDFGGGDNPFPFVGGWVRWVLDGRMWMVVVVGLVLIVVGCLPSFPGGKKTGVDKAGKRDISG